MTKRWLIIFFLIAGSALLSACSAFQSNHHIDCTETSHNNNYQISGTLSCSFTHFNETRERQLDIRIKQEQSITVEYQSDITKGSITFEFTDETGDVLFHRTFDHDESGQFELGIRPPGQIRVKLVGNRVSGSTHFSWSNKEPGNEFAMIGPRR